MAIINLIKGGDSCPIEIVAGSGEYTYGSYDYKITLSEPVKSGSNWTMSVGSYRKSTSSTSYSSRSIYYSNYSGHNGAAQKVQFKCTRACTITGSYGTAVNLTAGSTYVFYINRQSSGYKVYLYVAISTDPKAGIGVMAYTTSSSSSSSYITVPQTITIRLSNNNNYNF